MKIVKMFPGVQTPEYATSGSAGFDLRVFNEIETLELTELKPGEIKCVCTGLKVAVPLGFELQIRSRSGLALKGIVVANSPGTIDSDYRGEIKVILHNQNDMTFRDLKNGNRIAQAVLVPVVRAKFEVVEDLDQTERGEGGFGSTGIM